MEGDATLTKYELMASKLVQEIAKKDDHVPENSFTKMVFLKLLTPLRHGIMICSYIILSSLLPHPRNLQSFDQLFVNGVAFRYFAFFLSHLTILVINHGIENSLLEELIEVSKQFFALPLEEKLNCSPEEDILEGYGSDAGKSQSTILATKPENFRYLVDEYYKNVTKVNKVICKAMAKSLGLDENCLDFKKCGRTIARFTLYPRCPCPERILGTTGHADGATITYILPEKRGALFINLGEIIEVMTNGLFKSVMHRVGTNSVKDRVSVTLFFAPEDDETIEP
ncbi:putative 2-oxoglutarate-dependent dioxygenase ANS [Bienertia sinuspersici]